MPTAREAILLVGGQGTRLRPLTIDTPKPMLPVAGVPFLTHQLAQARDAGVEHVVLATAYRAEVFEKYFGDGGELGLDLEYVTEVEPLGTGGAIRNVSDRLRAGADDPVLIFNGDILTGVDLRRLVGRHLAADADVTLYLTRVADPRAFGLVPTEPNGRVRAFVEKPTRAEEIVTDQVNAGTYVFRRRVLDSIPAGRVVSVERETFPGLLADGAVVMGHVDPAYWLDLGTPAALVRGSCDLVLGTVPSPALPGEVGEFLVLPGGTVEPGAAVTGGTVVGCGARVAAGATVAGSVLFDDAVIEPGAVVSASVVGRGSRVGARTVLESAVLGDDVRVGADNELRAGIRMFPGARIGDGELRFSSDR